MWREYTRETPARRGLGLAISAAALATTVGMAYALTVMQLNTEGEFRRVHVPQWPISFELPASFTRASSDTNEFSGDEATIQQIEYSVPSKRPGMPTWLTIGFVQFEPGASIDDVLIMMSDETIMAPGEVPMGELTGTPLLMESQSGRFTQAAAAVSPDGLGFFVTCSHPESAAAADRVLRRVCASIRFENWYVPQN